VPVEEAHALEGGAHVAVCSVLSPGSNPPSSGPHYGTWAAFRTYATAIPRGFWIHSLEHGAVVITYNCPEGCAADVQAIEAMIAALPAEPLCQQTSQTVRTRVILTPDPKLDVRFAASSWGFTLRSDCFDSAAFRAFVLAHLGNAPENFCSDGVDVSVGYPETCGEE